jgi:pyridinium-3,5-bisthiocarboxylic acid mononucleotide nickel chelatase
MMKIAYFDCFSGISGDMVLGALLDLGLPREVLLDELRKIPVSGYSLRTAKEQRGLIAGTRVFIEIGEQPHRSFADIQEMIRRSELDAGIQERILSIFEKLALAESRVHNQPISEVHFHEVGAVDSILDVAGAVIGLTYLEVGKICSSPLPFGRGFVKTHHGLLPLPAPATVVLLEAIPVYGTSIERELVTPTGAAILATLAEGYGAVPEMTLLASGYGVGANPAADPPNLLRVLLGTSASSIHYRPLLLLETNVDDMNPEFYGYVLDQLFALGVLDASLAPIQMKKNRPGVMLSVLIEPALQTRVLELIFTETTTLGVRIQEVERAELKRRLEVIPTPYGPCQVKCVTLPGGELRVIPEYEACRRLARDHQMPIRKIYEEILFVARQAWPEKQ